MLNINPLFNNYLEMDNKGLGGLQLKDVEHFKVFNTKNLLLIKKNI